MRLVWIAAGGALGTLGRYGLSVLFAGWFGVGFPWGTLAVNVLGSFLLSVLFPLSLSSVTSPALRLALATGFLGAFTTFSTFTWEALTLVRESQLKEDTIYVVGSVLLALLAAWLGYSLAEELLARSTRGGGGI